MITLAAVGRNLDRKIRKKTEISKKMAPLVDPQKECPYYREDEVFTRILQG